MKMGEGEGGGCELLILSLAWCRISSESHTDWLFHCQVLTSIHHRTTLGQIHRKQSNPWSDYLISVDLRLVNSWTCKYSAEKWVVVPLWEWKKQTMVGRSEVISPSHFFSLSEGKYFVCCYKNECWYLWLVDIQSLYSIHLPYLGGLT